ncbi:MAG: Co2+/Mg2+ efflux protein ApaG [Rhizobiaceae bacterium]
MAKYNRHENRFEAITRGIRVSVTPQYLEEQSDPDENRFVWAYEVEIFNGSKSTVQLRERSWQITNSNGECEQVQGPGVVGEQPILNPGDAFQYTSGCPLTTSSGFMVGQYLMTNEVGEKFEVEIPAFSLDRPGGRGMMN